MSDNPARNATGWGCGTGIASRCPASLCFFRSLLSFWATETFRLRSTLSTGKEDGSWATPREEVPISISTWSGALLPQPGKPMQTYHPHEALYDWPLFGGEVMAKRVPAQEP